MAIWPKNVILSFSKWLTIFWLKTKKKIFFSFSLNQKKTTKYMAHRLKHPNEPLFRHRICDGLPPGLYLVIRNDCCCQGYLPFCRARGLSYHLHLLVLHTPAIQPHVSVAKAVISWFSINMVICLIWSSMSWSIPFYHGYWNKILIERKQESNTIFLPVSPKH